MGTRDVGGLASSSDSSDSSCVVQVRVHHHQVVVTVRGWGEGRGMIRVGEEVGHEDFARGPACFPIVLDMMDRSDSLGEGIKEGWAERREGGGNFEDENVSVNI